MSRTRVAGIAAAMLAVGLVAGMAGTVIAHDGRGSADCTALMAAHMDGQDMASMMAGVMGGAAMMGPGSSFGPGSLHELHHPAASPSLTR